jgi:hypothetical protein
VWTHQSPARHTAPQCGQGAGGKAASTGNLTTRLEPWENGQVSVGRLCQQLFRDVRGLSPVDLGFLAPAERRRIELLTGRERCWIGAVRVAAARRKALIRITDLTPAEHRMWKAFSRGEVVDFEQADDEDPTQGGAWGPERTVRAEVVRALLLSDSSDDGEIAALRLTGARISGLLNLQ